MTATVKLELGLLRRQRVRLIRQAEVAECGLASLAMVANYHGMDVDLGVLRRRFQPSLRGAALKSLISMADRLGLAPRAVKLPLEKLGSLQLPAILHWDMNHYVVLEEVRGGKALIHNPEGRSVRMPLSEVSEHFTGVALELRPTDGFETSSQRVRLRLSQLWNRITGLKRALVQTFVLSLVMQAFVLASPYYMQVALDSALPALDQDLLTVLALGFGLFTLINAGAALLRSFVLLSAGTSLGYGISVNVARRLFRLPVSWFEKRHVGDVLSRFQSIAPIREFMTEGAIGTVLDGTLALFTLAVMFFYSPVLALVALVAFALYGVVRLVSFAAQRDAQEEAIAASGREQSMMIESLRGIVTLRLFNRESQRHALWQTRLTDATNAGVGLARIGAWQQAANTLIFGLEVILSVWLAVGFVIDGGFSVGMVFAYVAYKTQFLQKGASLIDQAIAFRMLGLHLERLSDIALADQDRSFGQESERRGGDLKGGIELDGVRFRYSPTDPLVLNGVHLKVDPGEHIAITGASGGGKSTLMKVLLGLVEPDEGQVLIDGVPLARFGHKNFHDQIGAVLQEDSLFAGSLADNIALFDEDPDMMRIEEAAAAAAIHDEILGMPMGYETMVGDMGSALSGGQKQRLLLARALYRRPRVLLMDEGTSALDPAREQAVNAAVARLGITRIMIAHRLETILCASRIYAVQDGLVQEVTEQFAPIRHQLARR
ncbi:peptidase domain-containing ABC transporter [Sphingomonas sp. Leaf4]|uniref:peptidase domain-containing ABC transporter n=1 Tax=Sphingomonas sp. Leaf4 TaxID=2876553 RepID=UPI001E411C5D|nr:peptidase domain-containing ABC transporter [Sphingomonas sp. Leaf4]